MKNADGEIFLFAFGVFPQITGEIKKTDFVVFVIHFVGNGERKMKHFLERHWHYIIYECPRYICWKQFKYFTYITINFLECFHFLLKLL